MTKYITNVSQFNIGFTGLKFELPIGGWREVSSEDANHDEIKESARRGWIKIELTEPGKAEAFSPKLEISEPPVTGSKDIPKKKKVA